MPILPPENGYKRGRKKGFSFGVPVPTKTLRVHASQKERAAKLVTIYCTADEILRMAIDIGLKELGKQRCRQIENDIVYSVKI